ENLAVRVEPAPPRYHVSHGLGLHLYYVAREGYSGLDLAAAAAVWIKQADPTAGVELKHATRHPAYPRADGRAAGPVRQQTPTVNLAGLKAWLRREIDSTAVQAWLDEQELVPGHRYPHARCPIRPGEDSHGESSPGRMNREPPDGPEHVAAVHRAQPQPRAPRTLPSSTPFSIQQQGGQEKQGAKNDGACGQEPHHDRLGSGGGDERRDGEPRCQEQQQSTGPEQRSGADQTQCSKPVGLTQLVAGFPDRRLLRGLRDLGTRVR